MNDLSGRRSRLVGAVALIVVVIAMAVPAVAKPAQSNGGDGAGQPTVNSWALAPTGTDPNEPSSRTFLSYDIAPGAVINDSVTLWNYSNVQLTFQLYATDAFNNTSGAFELLAGDKAPVDVGAWIALPQANVTAPAQSKIDIPFTMTVPADARPGDHAAAILAASQVTGTGADGKVVVLDRRTGSRVYVRVSGPVQPALVLENVHSVYHSSLNPLGGSLDVTYTVRNTGNIRLAAHQHININAPLGVRLKQRTIADLPELLPGNAITLHEHFTGVSAAIRATTEIRLDPFSAAGAADVQVSAVTRAGRTWAIPWSVIVFLLELWLARRVYLALRRNRRRRSDPPHTQRRDRERELTPVA